MCYGSPTPILHQLYQQCHRLFEFRCWNEEIRVVFVWRGIKISQSESNGRVGEICAAGHRKSIDSWGNPDVKCPAGQNAAGLGRWAKIRVDNLGP